MKLLEEYRRDIWNCYRDSMCKYVFTWHIKSERFSRMCPSLIRYHFDAYSAQGRLDLARAMIENEIDTSDKMLDVVYKCQLCGGCDYVCGRIKEMQPGRIIQAMRAKLVSAGKAPPPEFRKLREDLRTHQNPYGRANAERADWIRNVDAFESNAQEKRENTKRLLYVGCSPLRDSSAQAMPETVLQLLDRAGYDIGLLGARERCCGNPSLRIGDQGEFVSFAKENIKTFNEYGVETLVCLCPFCYSTFRRDYPQVGEKMGFEVVHILDIVAQLIEEKALQFTKRKELTVTYHDPCHLGRIGSDGVSGTGSFTGLYDAPRRILNAIPGIRFVEMERVRDDALCCGAGSWMNIAYPEFAQSTARERLAEAETTQAEALVTHCPHCEENFGDAIRSNHGSMKIYNLLDLVLEAL